MGIIVNRLLATEAKLAFALIAVLSCSDGLTEPLGFDSNDLTSDEARRVAVVEVTLASSSIAVGQTTHAIATLYSRRGAILYRPVVWTSSDTSIAVVSDSGVVRALAVGSAVITAARPLVSGSATLTVTAATTAGETAPVASVSVALAASTLTPGQTTQATATTRDSTNNVLSGRVISWTSSNPGVAIVTSTGLVTALTTGSAQITASSEGQSGSATVNVQDVPPPPPPGSSNEPTGMTLITDRPFSAPNEQGWSDDFSSGMSFISDATAPHSAPGILRATYPAGYTSAGVGPGGSDLPIPTGTRTLYVSYWSRVSTSFYGHDSGVNKEFYAYNNGVANVYFNLRCRFTGTITPDVALQDMAVGGTYDISPNLVPAALIVRGQWYHIEVVLVGNTASTSNGSIDWWLDGVHIGSYNNLRFSNAAAHWDLFHYTTIWGGAGGPNLPVTMTKDWDHAYVSGKS